MSGVQEVHISDNTGNRTAVPGTADPVAGSGIVTTSDGTPGTNVAITVESGETYTVVVGLAASANTGEITSFSITGTAATDANKEWSVGLGVIIHIKIPPGVTTLNTVSTLASALIYMSKLNTAI